MDIAGLVKGASKGEGLGNQFLSNIDSAAIILHVVRCFEDSDIHHVDGSLDPLRDIETIKTELLLRDIDTVSKAIARLIKRRSDKAIGRDVDTYESLLNHLNNGHLAAKYVVKDDLETVAIDALKLITSKKVLYVCHVNEEEAANGNEYTKRVEDFVSKDGGEVVVGKSCFIWTLEGHT